MALSINNATPRPIYPGFDDQSGATLPAVKEQIPIHCPRFFIQSQTGPITDQLVSIAQAKKMFGDAAFAEGSKYFSHQSVGAVVAGGNANLMFIKRVLDENAKKARAVLCAEVVVADFEEYLRETDGTIQTDTNGDYLTDAGTINQGTLIRWSIQTVADADQWAVENVSPGTLVGATGETSTVYPILELEASHYGLYGSYTGFRFSFPNEASSDPGDSFVVEDQLTNIFRMQFVQKEDARSTAAVVQTQLLSRDVDFAFKENVTNTNTTQSFDVDRLITNYEDKTEGQVPVFGPIGKLKVYQDNLETILTLAKGYEEAATGDTFDDIHQMNIFTAEAWDGSVYETIRIDDSSISFGTSTTHYLLDGADGEISDTALDTLVAAELTDGWDNAANPVRDIQKYPFSCMYDTGFTLTTKRKFLNALAERPDIHVAVCTHVEGQAEGDIEADLASGNALLTEAKLSPESTVNGTPVVRAVITRSVMTWSDSLKKRRVPLIIDLIDKRSKYLGAANGYPKSIYAYDIYPNNVVSVGKDVTNTYATNSIKSSFWDAGVNGVQSSGRSNVFWPAVQTVYSDSTSVLNGDLTMQFMCELVKVADFTWVQTVGDQKNTDTQWQEKQEEVFLGLIDGRTDGRMTIEVDSYKTDNDELRGFSNTMDIVAYANVMRSVTKFNIISRRRED